MLTVRLTWLERRHVSLIASLRRWPKHFENFWESLASLNICEQNRLIHTVTFTTKKAYIWLAAGLQAPDWKKSNVFIPVLLRPRTNIRPIEYIYLCNWSVDSTILFDCSGFLSSTFGLCVLLETCLHFFVCIA